jgi:hypothetical protein
MPPSNRSGHFSQEKASMLDSLAHDLATMLIESDVDAHRVLTFMHQFLNVNLPVEPDDEAKGHALRHARPINSTRRGEREL